VGIAFVIAGAALWGTDALFRRGLALNLPAVEVVMWEHALLAALMLPLVLRRRAALRRLRGRDWIALAAIGGGSSVGATVLLTEAFRLGDPTTPLLLQKLQPVFVVALAVPMLGERLRPRYFGYLVVALAGSYLIAFADPTDVGVDRLVPAALGAGAALLWGLGTVLGRVVSPRVSPGQLTGLRFAFGLPVAAALVVPFGASGTLLAAGPADAPALVALALIPGLAALALYYHGLRRTPAASATLGELAFPLTALAVNALAFGDRLSTTQLLGTVVLAACVTALGLASRRGPRALGIRLRRRELAVPATP
jgi:drug/metabolite transporter (DMT)-like permease